MKRVFFLILLLLLILSTLLACSNNETGKKSADTETTTNISDSEEETTKPIEKPDFEMDDYEGKIFKILYPEWSLYNDYYFAEEANGDAMNDAIYERTVKVEEELNIDIVSYTVGYIETIITEIQKTVLAGSHEFDMAATHCTTSMATYVTSGLILNWNDIPHIDMSKSYWNKSVVETYESNGMLPFAVNDFILPDVNSLFFNKEMSANLSLEDPYEIVRNGLWTWDKLIEMSSDASHDLNGDGKFDVNDQYGFVGEMGWQMASIATSCDIYMIRMDSTSNPVLTIDDEKTYNIIEKMNKFLKSNDAYTWDYSGQYDPNQGGTPPVDFNDNKALFYLVPLSLASRFRTMDVDFGIIPLPKYNEAQENYTTLNWSGYMVIPMTVTDTDYVGKVVELLGYYNQQYVIPAFYDILLGQKISRDNESIEMLDIIFEDAVYDLGITLAMYGMTTDVLKGDGNFASYYAKGQKGWNNTIKKYGEACIEYMELHG